MLMELQGKKAAHDFLLIYNKDSRSPPLSAGFPLKTHDFLRTLEGGEAASASGAEMPPSAEHVLPGGIGTYSITHVSVLPSSKPERGTCAVVRGASAEGKPEPHGSSNGHYGPHAARSFPPWGGDPVPKDTGSTGRWPPPFAGRSANSFGSPPSSKHQPAPEKKRFIMDSAPIPGKPFPDDEEDEEDSQKVDLTARVDGKGNDQKQPSTPRSKHSATEQRRRSKINDRFQILRDLIPNSDQKRDKASFLLEVIEYIRFLQEKVHKYDAYPGWNQENAKLMPWNNQLAGDSITDHPHFIKNSPPAPGYMFSGKFDDNNISVAPVMLSNTQNPTESELSAGVPYKSMETPVFSSKEAAVSASAQTNLYASVGKAVGFTQPQQGFNSDTDSIAYQSQSQWLRSSCPAECTVSSATLNEQEELSVDEGTISVSSAYSQELLTTLTQALQSSGIDLSQASISVQINLGKRAINRHAATTTMSSAKDHDDPLSGNRTVGQSRVGSSREEFEPAPKRHKSDNS